MIRNYIKIYFRNFRRRFANNIFLILGLSVSFASMVFLISFIFFETHYDSFHKNSARIYRLEMNIKNNGQVISSNASTFPGVRTLLKDYPNISQSIRMKRKPGMITNNQSGKIIQNFETKLYYTDEGFFELFTFSTLVGDAVNPLSELNSLVVTKSFASKYFPDIPLTEVIGRTVTKKGNLEDELLYITAIIEDLPQNSHFDFDGLISYKSIYQWRDSDNSDYKTISETNMGWPGFYTYFSADEIPHNLYEDLSKEVYEQTKGRQEVSFYSQNIRDIHLKSNVLGDFKPGANSDLLFYLKITASFIISITLLNYINLFISKLRDSSKELGVRLVVGSTRLHLFVKSLIDSVITLTLTLILTTIIVASSGQIVEQMIDNSIDLTIMTQSELLKSIILGLIAWIFLSSLISTWIVSKFKISQVLAGNLKINSQKHWRTALLGINYLIAASLIFCTTIAARQYFFLTVSDLGFESSNLLIVKAPKSLTNSKKESLRNELLNYPSISEVTYSVTHPGANHREQAVIFGENRNKYFLNINGVNFSFIKAYDLQIVAGNSFEKENIIADLIDFNRGRINLGTEDHTVIVNEKAVEVLGFSKPEEIIGKDLFLFGAKKRIIGVVKDFHLISLKQSVEPLLLYRQEVSLSNITISFNNEIDVENLKAGWNTILPNESLEYYALSDIINQNYKEDRRFIKIVMLFTFLMFIICLVSLWALTSYNFQNKIKELTVRSIYGAGYIHLLILLIKQTFLVIIISFTIGILIAFPLMQDWLANFSSRIEINILDFIIPLLIILSTASVAILLYSIRIKSLNPTSNLHAQ
ncbi:ABC transporter permease [Ekhidna sp.]|jgi:putative ABC transport system permease protein|uniref:ABC transporter permease n=1 Tax=Ekhidna sp. TaxID=2608089 RepID=UPI0032ECEA6A